MKCNQCGITFPAEYEICPNCLVAPEDELAEAEVVCREIASKIQEAIEQALGIDTWGFMLMLFSFGEGGSLTYISNANREDMINVVKEWLEKAQGETL